MFKEVIDPDLHSDSCRMATKGFDTTPPVNILTNLQRLYKKPSYQELDAKLQCLNKPMNRMQPVEVMLRGIKEVQPLLLYNSEEEHALEEPNLSSYALIKTHKTGGMYKKDIEKCQKRRPQDRQKWTKFSARKVEDYE